MIQDDIRNQQMLQKRILRIEFIQFARFVVKLKDKYYTLLFVKPTVF